MRKLQDDYLAMCEKVGFSDGVIVDCKFPSITVGNLRTGIYPELEKILRANLEFFRSMCN